MKVCEEGITTLSGDLVSAALAVNLLLMLMLATRIASLPKKDEGS